METERLMNAKLTLHAQKRMKERLHIKSFNRQRRLAELALNRGMVMETEEETQIFKILFDNVIYIFGLDKSLLTVYPFAKRSFASRLSIPHHFDKETEEMMDEYLYLD